ncbi:hypothetical protein CRUP_021908 [Coryphaenoides rupestris]|nr:hypothetical protein CRUP_021908 [Coryphaenoides rupestris]
MAQKKNPKGRAKKDVKPVAADSQNGQKSDGGGSSGGGSSGGEPAGGGGGVGSKTTMFTWFVVLALLGVWSSVAVVYFDVVDYDSVIARAKEFHVNFSEVLQGLTKDGADDSENAESLEEVLDILAEEGSDWFYGFFTFLHDVVASPVDRGVVEEEQEEEEEEEGDEDRQAATRREGGTASDDMVEGVILDLLNQ